MEWDTTSKVYITAEAIIGFLSIFGNLVVLATVVRTPELHTVTNVFIGNLAMADITVGLIASPLAVLSFLGLPKNVYGCTLVNSLLIVLTNISILMLVGVAIERFIAIRLPFVYVRILTTQLAMRFNGALWILGTVLGLIPMYGWNVAPDELTSCRFSAVIPRLFLVAFQCLGLFVGPLIVMIGIYSYLYCVVRRHSRILSQECHQTGLVWKTEVRAAKIFALLIFIFVICWLPVNIYNCLVFFCPSCHRSSEFLLVAILMSHFNSSINPVLYAISNSRVQASILAIFSLKGGLDRSFLYLQSRRPRLTDSDADCYPEHKIEAPLATHPVTNEDVPNL